MLVFRFCYPALSHYLIEPTTFSSSFLVIESTVRMRDLRNWVVMLKGAKKLDFCASTAREFSQIVLTRQSKPLILLQILIFKWIRVDSIDRRTFRDRALETEKIFVVEQSPNVRANEVAPIKPKAYSPLVPFIHFPFELLMITFSSSLGPLSA